MRKIPFSANIGKVILESTKNTMVGYDSPPEQWARQAYAGLTAPPPRSGSFLSPEIANPKMSQTKTLTKSIPDLPDHVKAAAIGREAPLSKTPIADAVAREAPLGKTPITDAVARKAAGTIARTSMAQRVRDRGGWAR